MIVDTFSVQNFKSIESAELALGVVNVFIGANGSGKNNLLEAFGVLAAAAFGRVDDESLIRRGCRPGGYYKPLFKETSPDALTLLEAKARDDSYQITLSSPEPGRFSGWEFERELWTSAKTAIVNRTPENASKGDPQAGIAALRLAETPPDSEATRFLKALAAYSIYSPDTPILRGWTTDPQTREPVGLSGGRLGQALKELMGNHGGEKLQREMGNTVEWLAGFGLLSMAVEGESSYTKPDLAFIDRFFRVGKIPGSELPRHYFLSSNDVNEGVLYQIFVGVLCLHPGAPSLFAIDNGDHGLNPLLAKKLVQAMCDWLLNSERPRQLLMTTHNPLVLDALPLQDDRVRLFTVDRDNHGATNVQRFEITDKHREMAAKGWTLSRMWVNKLIGGIPNV
jgi:hypothetical protein